jgi:Pyridoxamine 5'-phosphate oxidase
MPKKSAKRRPAPKKTAVPGISGTKPLLASRPFMPGYGISKSKKGLLDWGWARERLTKSHNYVIVTVRPDGRPHAMGMHGLWFEDAFYFGTGDTTRKAKNLAANPNCILINENLEELIIVEGIAEPVGSDELLATLSGASKKKYGWPCEPGQGGVIFRVSPRVVFALPEKQFATAPTRWIFA